MKVLFYTKNKYKDKTKDISSYVVKYTEIKAKATNSGLKVNLITIEKKQVNFVCNFLRQNVFREFLGFFCSRLVELHLYIPATFIDKS